MNDNVCRFVPTNSSGDALHTVNYVYETTKRGNAVPATYSMYKINYVVDGEASVVCGGVEKRVKKGDIFFILPSVLYTVSGNDDFKYAYISFLGIRASAVMEKLGINKRNFVFTDFRELEKVWLDGLSVANELIDLVSEGVLLYTLARIGDRCTVIASDRKASDYEERFLLIKKYIDDNFSDSNLSLDKIAPEFSYNKKYLSSAFKKHFKIGVTEYLTVVRINHACMLMDQKYTGVSDIAFLCGFDDPMYFSKVFKKRMGISPKAYMNNVKR